MSNESLKIVKNTEYNSLDQLIQIIEISFVFLITFSLIALIDSAFNQANLYAGIASDYLGERDIGSLRGGNYEEIVRITLIFNLFLFAFSLFFGIWIRRTRDGWTWPDFGYSFRTDKYSFGQLMSRGVLLGLIAVLLYFIILMPISFYLNGDKGFLLFAYSYADGNIYSAQALNSEYYFGIVEMGFIWPASAGFFFFAYVYTSINNKFPTGVANILATFFYVFYLVFFFVIQGGAKIEGLIKLVTNPREYIVAWVTIFSLLVILYINFASFAETKSIVVPFVMNFVFNVGITLVRAVNSLIFFDTGNTVKMLILPLIVLFIVIIWYIKRREDFSTIKIGINHLRSMNYSVFKLIGFFVLFMLLSFLVPGIINELLFKKVALDYWVITALFAIDFLVIISISVVVLTYEPTDVHDVLLISNDGLPIGSHI